MVFLPCPSDRFSDLTNLKVKRDWSESNRRPSASDWCEFPHSLDYSFTIGIMPVGGGRYAVGLFDLMTHPPFLQPVSAPSLLGK